jgi:hypothetical protein
MLALRARLLRMWESVLPQMSPRFVGDRLEEVLTVRPRRVLLLSNLHIIYCKARYNAPESFRMRWYLEMANINNVLGAWPLHDSAPAAAWRRGGACAPAAAVADDACTDMRDGMRCVGDEGRLTVLLRAASIVKVPCAGTWRIPVTKRIRTGSLEIFERTAAEINDQVTIPQFTRHEGPPEVAAHDTRHLPLLRIVAGAGGSQHGHADSDVEEDGAAE